MPAGRKPFEMTEEVLQKVELMASRGLTQEQIAHNIGLHAGTFSTKKGEIPELSEAIKRGQAAGIRAVSNALFNNATKENNTTAQIFYLKARAGWRDNDNSEADKDKELVQE